MKIEYTPFMRTLQERIATGRKYIANLSDGDEEEMYVANNRLHALGLWLAEEVVAYRMEVGTQLYMAMPMDAKYELEIRLWVDAQKRKNTRPFPTRPVDRVGDSIIDRIWNVLNARQDRYIAMIAQIDPSIAAERDREQERRYRECFGSDKAYAEALAYERSFAAEKHYAQAMLTAEAAD